MLEFARYEGRHRRRGATALSVGIAALVALYVWLFPSVEASGVDLEAYVEAFPPAVRQAFGIEALGTIEGFLAAELYAFVWVLLLALYFAYSAATLVADDVESGRMDVTLSLPVRRSRVVVEKYLSLLVPLVAVNVVTPLVVYAGVLSIDESISATDLLAVHAMSVPYLLAAAAIGLVASVAFDRTNVAQRVALVAVFGLFLVESVLTGTDYEAVGALSPTRYFDPTAALVRGEYDVAGAVILLAAAVALVAVSAVWFTWKDVE